MREPEANDLAAFPSGTWAPERQDLLQSGRAKALGSGGSGGRRVRRAHVVGAERSAWLSPASGQGLGLWLKDKTWVQVCSGVSGCQAGVGTGMGARVGRSVLP